MRIVELESFKKLLKVANNKIDLKCRKTYTKMIEVKGEELREDIVGIINVVKEDTKNISFTTDAWTSLSGDPLFKLDYSIN